MPEGLKPVKIYVEDEYVRAARGGIGFTKAAANYAASIYAGEAGGEEAAILRCCGLTAVERKYVEEVGAMNIVSFVDRRQARHPARCAARSCPASPAIPSSRWRASLGYEVEERQVCRARGH